MYMYMHIYMSLMLTAKEPRLLLEAPGHIHHARDRSNTYQQVISRIVSTRQQHAALRRRG